MPISMSIHVYMYLHVKHVKKMDCLVTTLTSVSMLLGIIIIINYYYYVIASI